VIDDLTAAGFALPVAATRRQAMGRLAR